MSFRDCGIVLQFLFSITALTCCLTPNAHGQSKLTGKDVLFVVARQDFRDEELFAPQEVLKAAGYTTHIASSKTGKLSGALGGSADAEMTIDQVNPLDYAAIIFVGGAGSKEYWDNPTAHDIARNALIGDRIVGAICIAPVTLSNAGILKGKNATVFSSEIDTIKRGGAIYTGKPVEVDGNIVTGNGPGAAPDFGKEIAKLLKTKRGK
ncbi:MAG: DJ-1/PfpI family protein [Candidatus Omnitrophica bacterium]|nr:DJ-1/PfpI family protein [Candidatus Omnitrophota bacterium]